MKYEILQDSSVLLADQGDNPPVQPDPDSRYLPDNTNSTITDIPLTGFAFMTETDVPWLQNPIVAAEANTLPQELLKDNGDGGKPEIQGTVSVEEYKQTRRQFLMKWLNKNVTPAANELPPPVATAEQQNRPHVPVRFSRRQIVLAAFTAIGSSFAEKFGLKSAVAESSLALEAKQIQTYAVTDRIREFLLLVAEGLTDVTLISTSDEQHTPLPVVMMKGRFWTIGGDLLSDTDFVNHCLKAHPGWKALEIGPGYEPPWEVLGLQAERGVRGPGLFVAVDKFFPQQTMYPIIGRVPAWVENAKKFGLGLFGNFSNTSLDQTIRYDLLRLIAPYPNEGTYKGSFLPEFLTYGQVEWITNHLADNGYAVVVLPPKDRISLAGQQDARVKKIIQIARENGCVAEVIMRTSKEINEMPHSTDPDEQDLYRLAGPLSSRYYLKKGETGYNSDPAYIIIVTKKSFDFDDFLKIAIRAGTVGVVSYLCHKARQRMQELKKEYA